MGKLDVVLRRTMWYLGFTALMLMDSEAHATKPEDEAVKTRHCHLCEGAVCAQPAADVCPEERPFCATRARAPDFTSSLVCAAAPDGICSLNYFDNTKFRKQQHEMICVCSEPLCNTPFTQTLKNELVKFASANNTGDNLLDTFWNQSSYANATASQLYRAITVENKMTLYATTSPIPANWAAIVNQTDKKQTYHIDNLSVARAEALKQEASMVADDEDDDDDDSEGGSGSYEDTHLTPSTAPVDTHPSLPEEKPNSATTLLGHSAVITLIFFTL